MNERLRLLIEINGSRFVDFDGVVSEVQVSMLNGLGQLGYPPSRPQPSAWPRIEIAYLMQRPSGAITLDGAEIAKAIDAEFYRRASSAEPDR